MKNKNPYYTYVHKIIKIKQLFKVHTAEIFYKHKPDLQRDIIRERCRHFQITATIDWSTHSTDILDFYAMYIPDDASHGDICTTSTKHLRSMEVYFVLCL